MRDEARGEIAGGAGRRYFRSKLVAALAVLQFFPTLHWLLEGTAVKGVRQDWARAESAGIDRHRVGDERSLHKRRSCSIMAPSHVRVAARLHVMQLRGGKRRPAVELRNSFLPWVMAGTCQLLVVGRLFGKQPRLADSISVLDSSALGRTGGEPMFGAVCKFRKWPMKNPHGFRIIHSKN